MSEDIKIEQKKDFKYVVYLAVGFLFLLVSNLFFNNNKAVVVSKDENLIPKENTSFKKNKLEQLRASLAKASDSENEEVAQSGIFSDLINKGKQRLSADYLSEKKDANIETNKKNNTWNLVDFTNESKKQLYSNFGGEPKLFVFKSKNSKAGLGLFPSSDFVLPIGAVIKIVIRSKGSSDYIGSYFFGIVKDDVYDFNNNVVLIDKGSTVSGTIQSIITQNPVLEQRMALVVNKIKRTDGFVIDFEQLASSSDGTGGISGDVNKHSLKKYGGFIAFSLVGSGISLSASNGEALSSSDKALRDLTQGLNTGFNSTAKNYIDIQNTISFKDGDLINVMIHEDIKLTKVEGV